ncbi:homocysteine S-methyltransferase family protein [Pseudomonadota bacterium]
MINHISWIEGRLESNGPPLVIDGGMGTLLQKSGVPMDGRVWSGRAVLSHPEAVCRAHQAFISAGAEVIITNTFAAGRHMLEPAGLGDQVAKINNTAVALARQACDHTATHPIAIAGSICEWAPSEDPRWGTPESIGQSVREQSGILAKAGVDLIALEMCENTPYSVAAIEAALETGLPVWVGVSARTHEGRESLSVFDYAEIDFDGLARSLSGFPVMMMNVMHTPLQDVDEAVEIVRRYWDGPVGIYPEAGYFKMPDWQFVDIIEPDDLAARARTWIDDGIRMIGGCCGLGPEHIAALRAL